MGYFARYHGVRLEYGMLRDRECGTARSVTSRKMGLETHTSWTCELQRFVWAGTIFELAEDTTGHDV